MPILLRVKRRKNDVPVEIFASQRYAKRVRTSSPPVPTSLFRYIGSHSSAGNLDDMDFSNLDKDCPHGSSKLLWNAKHGTIIEDDGKAVINSQVNIQTLKRGASPSSDAADPIPFKIYKIIDVIPTPAIQDPLADAIGALEISATKGGESVTKLDASDALGYVFDIYSLECRRSRDSSAASPENISASPINQPEISFSDDDELRLHHDYNYDDDEDSNSESNWRNDYPDEECESSNDDGSSNSSNSSCTSSSPKSSRWASSGRSYYRTGRRLLEGYRDFFYT